MASAHAACPSVSADTSTVQTTTARCQFPISQPSPCGRSPRHLSPATGSGASSVVYIVTCLPPICHALYEAVVLYWQGTRRLNTHLRRRDHGSLQVIYGQRWREPYRGDQGRGASGYQDHRHDEF